MTAAMLLESALRAMVMAAVVAGGLRVLRVQHVMARKLAWCLVLLTALAMPLLMRRAVVVRVPGLESVQQFVRLRSAFAAAEMPAAPSASVSDPMAAAEGSDVSGMVPDRAMNRSGMGVQGTVAPAERKATLRRASHGVTRSARATEPQKAIFAAGAACLTATPHTTGRSGWMTAAHAKSAILFIWAAGSAILFLRLLTGLVLALRLWMRAEPASVLVEPRGAVRISDAVKTPVTVGNGIVLPEVYAEWGRKKLRMVLAHELAHVRQGDFWL
jgi:BlaR1 peptidase M56